MLISAISKFIGRVTSRLSVTQCLGSLAALLLLQGTAHAHDVTVNITGEAINASCDISAGDKTQTVKLDDVSPSDFPSVGSVTKAKSFTVDLSKCFGSTITTAFEGTNDSLNPALLALSGANPAKGIAIQLLDKQGAALDIRDASSNQMTGPDATLSWQLQYKSTSEDIKSGEAGAVLYLAFAYQ